MKWDSWFRRRRWEDRMDAEFRFHLDSLIAEHMQEGCTREEAELRARREFGALDLAKDECRDERPAEWLDHIVRDLAFAARSLRRNPGFAAAAILTLALGIGANTAIFSVVYSVLFKPLPYAHPEQIHSVEIIIPERASQFPSLPVTIQAFLEWRKSGAEFAGMAALRPWEVNLVGDGEPERTGGAHVSANFFSFLGVAMQQGRGFTPDEETPGRENVVVISDSLWRRRFGADPAIIGRRLNIGTGHTVVGVAPASLLVPTLGLLHPNVAFASRVEVWKPIAPSPRELQNESWDHGMLIRLRPGQDPRRASEQLRALLNAYIRAQHPELKIDLQVRLMPIREIYAGKVRLRLLLILAASAVLLLTAFTNIANLFLARVASRASEFATRIALGAGRSRILSQMLAETTLFALAGGILGAFIASNGAAFLAAQGPEEVRLLAGGRFTLPVFAFAMLASLLMGLACAAFPAWQLYRGDSRATLQEGGRSSLGGPRAARSRQFLVAAQMALGTALLASAGLLLHSFVKVMNTDRGYQVERVLAVDLSLFGPRQNPAAFYSQLSENLRALPGVLAAGAINDLPALSGASGASRTIFHSSDTDYERLVLQRPVAMIRSVTTGYFAASGTALQAGRFFSSDEQAQVALVSESLAARLWPGEPPSSVLGRVIRQGNVGGPTISIVGVVRDVRGGAVEKELPPFLYRPYPQWASGPATIVVRTSQDPAALAPAVRSEIRKLNANLPIPAIRTMREIVSSSVAERRFQMMLTSLFALVALLLGSIGVYGVVSYSVACRTRDIGLRIALGALRTDILRWVVFHGLKPVLAGLTLGLAAAVAIATALRSLLFGIAPTDPIALTAVVFVLLSTSLLACYLPARRAARLDPITALRHE